MGTSTPIIKSFRPILLIVVTFLKTHRFLPIKILFFLNLILKIKYIIKLKIKKKRRRGVAENGGEKTGRSKMA
jgi:hypothetical protein